MPESMSRFSPPVVTADPSGVTDGDIWYRSDEDRFKARVDGVSSDLSPAIVTYPNPVSGAWYDPYGMTNSAQELGTTLNAVHCMPVTVNKKVTLAGIAVAVVTVGTASNVGRMALYSGSVPTTLITDYGTVSTTSSGVKTWTPTDILSPSVQYWIAYVSQVGTAATLNAYTPVNFNSFYHVASGTPTTTHFGNSNLFSWPSWTASGAFAGSPSVVVAYGSNSTRKPRIMIKFS